MNIESLRNYCLSQKGAEESFPFGEDTLVFKVNNKIFLLAALEAKPLQFNVKADPEEAILLREEYPVHVLPGYHMNKKHWNTVISDGTLTNKLLKHFIDESYRLVAGKKN